MPGPRSQNIRRLSMAADLTTDPEVFGPVPADGSQAEASLRQQRELLRVTLASIGDAILTTDAGGRVTFLNPVAESLTGWACHEAKGLPLETVFRIVNEQSRRPAANPATRALQQGASVGLANHTLLIARDGTERSIDASAVPIRDEQGNVGGGVDRKSVV